MENETVLVEAYSDWHHSEGDATSECNDRLNSNEDDEKSQRDSDGWSYIGSSDNGLDTEYNESEDLFQTYGSRELEFKREKISAIEAATTFYLNRTEYSKEDNSIELDIDAKLKESLEGKLPETFLIYIRGNNNIPPNIPDVARPLYESFKNTKLYSVDFKNIKIQNSELILDKENISTIPFKTEIRNISYENCISSPQTIKGEKSFETTKGYKLEISRTIVSKTKITGSLKFGIKQVSGEFKKERETTVTLNDKRTYSVTSREISKYPYEVRVPAMTKISGKMSLEQNQGFIPYSGKLTLTADVVMTFKCPKGWTQNGSKYPKHTKKITEYLKNEIDRTIDLKGTLGDINVENYEVKFTEEKCNN